MSLPSFGLHRWLAICAGTVWCCLSSASARAEASYVYHERTGNDPGCGGSYVSRLYPSSSQSVTVRFKVENQFYVNTARIYYTTDGSTPAGAFGTGSGTTQVGTASFACTFGDPVVDVWEATIPAQSAGTTVKYILGAWHTDGGDEIFANGCGNCGSENSSSSLASVFEYTVADAYTWTGASGDDWSDTNKWNPAGRPDSPDVTANVNSALTVNVTGGPFTFGTLATALASGNVVIGNNSLTTDQLTAQVSSGTPTINVANSSANIFYYASLLGSQGFNKTGSGKFTFRFNGADQAYTGNLTISAGVLGINQNGSLGEDSNDLNIANGARLLAEPGSNTGTITLPLSRTITLSGAQSQIGASPAAVTLIVQGSVTESAAGMGLVKTDAGKLTLAGTVGYTGETRIAGGTLALSGSALLPSGQNLRFNQSAAGTLDVGGTAQTVRTIVMDVTSANRTFTGGGSLTVNGDANLQLNASNGVVYDFSGLNSFIFNRSNRQLNVQTLNAASVTTITDLNFAKSGGGVNTVTASQVLVGGGNSDGNNGNTSRLHLGTQNTFNSTTLQIGGFNAGGVVDFQSGLTTPFLKLRGADGSSAMATLKIGETSSGSRRGEGVLNLTGGTLDALVTDTLIGRHIANANINDTSSLTMPGGSLASATLLLAEKTGTGTPTLTASLTQGGGTVQVQTLTMGKDAGGGATARLLPTYNLNGGTLFAASIDGGGGAFAANSARTLNLNGGTLRNYNSTTDLTVDGTDATAGGLLNVVLASGTQTVEADTGRTLTFTALAPISGAGHLTKTGNGTLLLNGANAHLGGTTVSAGTLGGSGSLSSALDVNSDATLAPGAGGIGSFTVNSTVALAGNCAIELDKSAGQTSDKLLGVTTLTAGGTLTIANLGPALAAGDSFPVFSATTYAGSYSSITPAPGAGLAWDTERVRTNGVLLVHNAPVAGNNVASVAQGQSTTIAAIKLLANDSDADNDPLTIVSASAVSGSASLSGGNVNYTAPLTGTSDTITYTISDGRGGTASAAIHVTLTSGASQGFNQLSLEPLGDNTVRLTYLGIPGTNYALDWRTNLAAGDWVPVITNPAAANGQLVFTNTSSAPENYFRTRYVP